MAKRKSPSDLHQGLVDLVRADPAFVIDLVHRAAGLLGARGVEIRDLGTDLRVLNPLGDDRHLRPDLVLGVFVGKRLREVWLGEVQLHTSARKLDVISVCRAAAQLHYGVKCFSFVLSPKPGIRTWMRRASLDVFDPPVIVEPDDFPSLEQADARSRPHACFLRAFFHANAGDALRVAVAATRTLSLPERQRYTAMLLQFTEPSMNDHLKQLLRELEAEPEPDEWDRSRAGWQRAYGEGKAEGKAEGELAGRLRAKIEALLDLLEVRGFVLDEPTLQRITACTELARVEGWCRLAKHASSLDAVFDPSSLSG